MTTTTACAAIIALAVDRCRNPVRPALDAAGELDGLYARLERLMERQRAGEDVTAAGRAVVAMIKEREAR